MRKHAGTAGLLALAAVLVALGLRLGQAREVFSRAVRVCLECIGVG